MKQVKIQAAMRRPIDGSIALVQTVSKWRADCLQQGDKDLGKNDQNFWRNKRKKQPKVACRDIPHESQRKSWASIS